MKHLRLKLILLVLLICLAFASAAFAVKPLIDGAEKSVEVKQAVEEFNESIGVIRRESEEKHEVIPYANLYEAMQTYNRQLYLFKQNKGVIILIPQDQFFGKNKTVVHKVFPGKPVAQLKICVIHAHLFEFTDCIVFTVMQQIKEYEFCAAFFI